MTRSSKLRLKGRFRHLVYSPRGEVEGVLITSGDTTAQVVFARHDDGAPQPFTVLHEGQTVEIEATPAAPSPKGEGAHPVYDFGRLLAVDGGPPVEAPAEAASGYRGRVERFNYARHGEINGVVLDSGDFLHLKPEGYAALGLAIGDLVEADGDAQALADGRGWAVEASVVNGRPVTRR